jgi:hypothetical protein
MSVTDGRQHTKKIPSFDLDDAIFIISEEAFPPGIHAGAISQALSVPIPGSTGAEAFPK